MTSSSSGSTGTGGSTSLTGSTAARNTAVATPELLLSGFYPTGIAVDTNNLYWTTLMGELMETLLSDWMCIEDYAVTGDSVYFAYYGWSKVSESALYRMPLK